MTSTLPVLNNSSKYIETAITTETDNMLTIAEFIEITKYPIDKLYINKFWTNIVDDKLIHLDIDLIKFIGFTGSTDKIIKDQCIRLLTKFLNAQENIDYIKSISSTSAANKRGKSAIEYYIQPNLFKEILLTTRTSTAKKIRQYYIAVESLFKIYTKYQHIFKDNQLKLQQNEHQKQLETYQQRLQLAERISSLPPQRKINTTSSIIYIAANEPMANKNIYKIGHISTNSRQALSNRLISYATGYDQPLQYIAIYPVYQAKHIDTFLSRLLLRFKHIDNQQKELVTAPLSLIKRYIEQYLSNIDSLITSINDLSIDDYVEQMKQTPKYKPLSIQEACKLANNEEEPIQSTPPPKPEQSMPAFYKDNKIDIDMLVNEVISQIKNTPITWQQVKKMTNERINPIKAHNKRNSNYYIDWNIYKNTIKLKAKDKQIIITINSR